MAKTFSLPRGLVIRIEIFGLVFLAALLVGLCSGCGDGTEPVVATDSGIVGTGTKTGTGTCSIPGPSETYTSPHAGTTVQYFVAEGTVSCSNPAFSQVPYKGFTCQELVTNSMSTYSLWTEGGGPCCVRVTKDASHPGHVIVDPSSTDVACGASTGAMLTEGGQYALCSASGVFMGWICPYSIS